MCALILAFDLGLIDLMGLISRFMLNLMGFKLCSRFFVVWSHYSWILSVLCLGLGLLIFGVLYC